MFVTVDELGEELRRQLTKQKLSTDPIMMASISDLHNLILAMDSKFTSILWYNGNLWNGKED